MSIDKWHYALEQASGIPAEETGELANNLKQVIRRRRPLGRLATTPLLCAMICALHYARGGHNLPAERIRLYDDCIQMLLERRDEARRIPLERDYPDLGYDEKLDLIRHFAYWMMLNDHSEVEVEEADGFFTHHLSKTVHSGLEGSRARRFFVERSSLLREPVAGRIDFTHRTFQEFLAAQAIFDRNDFPFLLKQVRDDQWRETIILASGYAGTRRKADRTKFLRDLIARGKKFSIPKSRYQVHLLAVACLEGNAGLERETQEYVLEEAGDIFPPSNEEDAKLIASAGDPAVPLLEANPDHNETEAAMCIRTLALIGSETALQALTQYTTDERGQVTAQLGRAWEAFDLRDYVERIFRRCQNLDLSWSSVSDLRPLAGLSQLTGLDLMETEVEDLNPLAGLSKLTHLDLSGTAVSDLRPLAGLSKLTSLDLSRTTVKGLSPLAGLSQLTSLDLSRTMVKSLSPLAGLSKLIHLDLDGAPVSDLSPLVGLFQLTSLDLGETEVKELNSLAGLSQLTRLNLSGTPVSDLSPLAGLSQLSSLYLNGTQVSDLSLLTGLSQLAHLSLYKTPVSDLSLLVSLPQLIHLNLSDTPVSDLSPLAGLSQLTGLYLSGAAISDLSPLAGLSHLTHLNLIETTVSDLSLLARLPQLTRLSLSGTPVSDLSPLAGLSQLTYLDLQETPVKDLSPLAGLHQLKELYINKDSGLDLTALKDLKDLKINPRPRWARAVSMR